jgi:hypothetical protein
MNCMCLVYKYNTCFFVIHKQKWYLSCVCLLQNIDEYFFLVLNFFITIPLFAIFIITTKKRQNRVLLVITATTGGWGSNIVWQCRLGTKRAYAHIFTIQRSLWSWNKFFAERKLVGGENLFHCIYIITCWVFFLFIVIRNLKIYVCMCIGIGIDIQPCIITTYNFSVCKYIV